MPATPFVTPSVTPSVTSPSVTSPVGSSDTGAPLHHAAPAIVVHRALRRELRLAGPLVRRVDDRDVGRARVVVGHLDLLLRGLHHHHELEDELIWPLLHARVGNALQPLVHVMEAQHLEIADLALRSTELLAAWEADARAEERDLLARRLDELDALVAAHLDLEERDVLPLAERHLTPTEWRRVGQRAEAGFPRRERAVVRVAPVRGRPGGARADARPGAVAGTRAGAAPRPARLPPPRHRRARHADAVTTAPVPHHPTDNTQTHTHTNTHTRSI